MKVAHIFSDEKFVDKHIIKYGGCDFLNDYFYMKSVNSYNGVNKLRVKYVRPGSSEYLSLVEDIDQYDILILYFLTIDKIQLVEDIWSSKVKIVWSFYGAELYSLPTLKYEFLSDETQRAMGIRCGNINWGKAKDFLRLGVYSLKGQKTMEALVRKACKRIDYFLWYNKFEYDYLNERMGRILPPFMQSTLNNRMENVTPNPNKNNSIVVGNSCNPFNNHLDAIELFRKSKYKGKVVMPFSYGNRPRYSKKVKKVALRSGLDIDFIESFVTYETYIDNLNKHSAAVYPSFRQMGLGNIFIAVRCGLKIYLSKNNPTLTWLQQKGMKIFTIEGDLWNDVQAGRLMLNSVDMSLNNLVYDTLVDSINDKLFFKELRNIMNHL